MIKYLGSKRRLIPVLSRICDAAGARTALDLFTGTTRVAQAFKRRGAFVTAVDSARYSEVFARCYVETDATTVDKDDLRDAIEHLQALPGRPGYVTETFCERARFFQPFNGARIDAIRDVLAARLRGVAAVPDPPHEPRRGRRSGRLDDRRADGLREVVGAALLPPPRAPRARTPGGRRTGRPRRRARAGGSSRRVRPRVPRPALQPAPLLHELPRVGDARGLGRSRALRRCVQAHRRA